MSQNIKNRKKPTYYGVLICGIVCVLLGIKSYLFYSHVNLAEFTFLFTIITPAILLAVWSAVSLISPKAAAAVGFTLYTVISVFMAVDAVYYAYTSRMPSAAQLGMAWQLTDVSSTILNLIRPYHIAMIIDLPLWCLYAANRSDDKIRPTFADRLEEKLKRPANCTAVYSAAGSVTAVVIAAAFLWNGFLPEYMQNELFCYHARDFYITAVNGSDERTVDKSAYIQKSEADSSYFGLAKGRNLIVIQVEAMQNFVIGAEYEGQEIMPNLNRLISEDSFYFPNYYYQIGGGNTADAEFAVNNSLFAPEREAAYVRYSDNTFHGLPYLLKDNGYSGAHVFHNYIRSFWNREKAYPALGFDSFTALEDFEQDDMFPMGLSDKSMFRQSMEWLKSYEEPFYAFYITVSSHHPYAIPLKDREIVLKPEDEGTLFGLYIQAMNYADRAIGEFIEELKEAGLYDRTMIAIYGDHYGLANTDPENSIRVAAMTDGEYSIFDVFNVPFIVNIPGLGYAVRKEVAGGHIDALPTMLCLLGIDNDKAVMFGQNLLEAEHGFVCEQTHVAIGSFISDNVYFKRPYNNIKSNFDAYAKADTSRLDPDLFKEESDLAAARIYDCQALLENDDILIK